MSLGARIEQVTKHRTVQPVSTFIPLPKKVHTLNLGLLRVKDDLS